MNVSETMEKVMKPVFWLQVLLYICIYIKKKKTNSLTCLVIEYTKATYMYIYIHTYIYSTDIFKNQWCVVRIYIYIKGWMIWSTLICSRNRTTNQGKKIVQNLFQLYIHTYIFQLSILFCCLISTKLVILSSLNILILIIMLVWGLH